MEKRETGRERLKREREREQYIETRRDTGKERDR